jgi:hypothetical protein
MSPLQEKHQRHATAPDPLEAPLLKDLSTPNPNYPTMKITSLCPRNERRRHTCTISQKKKFPSEDRLHRATTPDTSKLNCLSSLKTPTMSKRSLVNISTRSTKTTSPTHSTVPSTHPKTSSARRRMKSLTTSCHTSSWTTNRTVESRSRQAHTSRCLMC